MEHNKMQTQIIEDCIKAGACKEEFKKLVSATSDKEFWKVINDNLDWCLEKKIIKKEYRKHLDLTDDRYKYLYCLDVSNEKSLWSTITDDHYKYLYCRYVSNEKSLDLLRKQLNR